MLSPRLIVALLVDRDLHLVKTTSFAQRHYLGDPLNAAYVFSGYEVDELLVLDIDATPESRSIPLRFVEALARFTSVPLSVGGGIHSLTEIHDLLSLGVEKVVLSAALRRDLSFLEEAVARFGSSTITVVLNIYPGLEGPLACFGRPGPTNPGQPLVPLALACQSAGAGEILIYDTRREGTRSGFDVSLLAHLNDQLTIPLAALGGCGERDHIEALLSSSPLSGVAAGSLFAYAPHSHQVLLNYPHISAWLQSCLPALEEGWR
ncbi:MAG: HisA/HisF-related TIM barrel protein [Cyanobacteriota bacterium]